MKTYETMAQDALRRIHSLEQKKAARQRTARRLLLPAICIGVAGAAALGWHSAGRLQPAPSNSTPAAVNSARVNAPKASNVCTSNAFSNRSLLFK